MAQIPTYLAGGPSRRPSGLSRLATPLFVAAILAVNYWVFVVDSGPEAADPTPDRALHAPAMPTRPQAPQLQLPAEPPAPEVDRVPARVVKGSIRRGEMLGRILHSAGIQTERYRAAIAKLDPLVDFKKSRVGDRYRVELNQAGQILEIRYARSLIEVYEARLDERGEGFVAKKVDVPIRKERMRVGCAVSGTLYDSLVRCAEDPALASRIIRLISYDLNFYEDVRDGDTVRFLVDREYVRNRFYRYGPIMALSYRGKFQTLRVFHFHDGTPGGAYYREDGKTVRRTFLKSPVEYTRVSSGFQKRRYHPVLHRYKKHLAVDYAAPVGTPVWAVASGKVVFRKRRGASGNLVVIRHDDGYRTYYAHLHRFAKGLTVGERVRQGEVIGFVGATGRATGPHLHFAIHKGRRILDPLRIEGVPVGEVSESMRGRFEETTRRQIALLEHIEVLAPSRRRL